MFGLNFLKNKRYPKIVIKYGKLIDPVFTFYCQNNPELKERGWNDWMPPTKEKVLERIKDYKDEWKKYEKEILSSLSKISGLKFKRNILDVYIVSGNSRQCSDPLIIKSGFTPDEFVDTLTHELIHVLFQDNVEVVYGKIFEDMFPQESALTQSHVLVHAILKYIYLDILKDNSRLERNITNSEKHKTKDYIRAWEIVEEIGYKKLIEDFKKRYKKPLNHK